MTGGAGFDTIDYNGDFDNCGVPTHRRRGHGQPDHRHGDRQLGQHRHLHGIERVRGSNFADVLTGGNPERQRGHRRFFEGFHGQGGNDTITAARLRPCAVRHLDQRGHVTSAARASARAGWLGGHRHADQHRGSARVATSTTR
jgi:hypothetical protein